MRLPSVHAHGTTGASADALLGDGKGHGPNQLPVEIDFQLVIPGGLRRPLQLAQVFAAGPHGVPLG